MNNTNCIPMGLLLLTLFFGACSSTRSVTEVRDDVYYMPSVARVSESTGNASVNDPVEEDYYDSATSAELNATRGYYDMTYNDPYYYNYDRFGFGAGSWGWNAGIGISMGWGNPCMGSGWGMGMGSGYWPGNYPGMYGSSPWMYDPWYGYPAWGYGSRPFGSCGFGPYYGPWGSCYGCYAPIVVCGNSNTVISHRPTLGGGGAVPTSGSSGTRMTMRDPVSLDPMRRELSRTFSAPVTNDRARPITIQDRSRNDMQGISRPAPSSRERGTSPTRTTPQRVEINRGGGGFDRGGGSSRPPGVSRPR